MTCSKTEDIENRLREASGKEWLCLNNTDLRDEDLDEILKKITDYKQLNELSFDNNPLTDAGIKKIAGYCTTHPNITFLSLNSIPSMTDDSALLLLKLINLTRLDLWKCRQISAQFATAALQQNHLQQLDIRDTKICLELQAEVEDHLTKQVSESTNLFQAK